MAVRTLSVVMDMDTGRATAKLGEAGRAIKQFGLDTRRSSDNISHMGKSFSSLGAGMDRPLHQLRDYVLVLGNLRMALLNVRDLAVGWVWGLMKQAGELERLTVLMKGFSKATTEAGKTEEAANNLGMLMNAARNTGFEMKALTDSFVKFQSADLNPTTYSLNGLTQAVAKFGGDSDIMHRASIAIQQMAGKGKISMEELRQQLGEAVPTAMQTMARALGVTVAKLGDEIKKGHVAAKPALELMLRDMEIRFGGAGKQLANTFFGQLAQVKTNMMQLSADFVGMGRTDGLFEGAKNSLKELNELMRSGEGRQAMMQLGHAVASVATALSGSVQFIIRWRSEIGTLLMIVLRLWAASKAVQVFGWMASMGKTLADSLRNVGNAAISTDTHLGRIVANSNANVAAIDRQRAAYDAFFQKAQQRLATANDTVAATRAEISSMEDLKRSYTTNINMLQAQQRQERSNLQTAQTLHAANISQGRSGATSAMMVKQAQDQLNTTTRSLIGQQRLLRTTNDQLVAANSRLALAENEVVAATARMTLAERANALSKGFLATAARACQGSIGLLIASVNAETGAVARATLAERVGAVAKAAYASASRAVGIAVSFMGRMVSLALGPIGAIGIAAYTAAQYFGLFTDRANQAAAAAANLRGQMASLNDVKEIQGRIDEIDTTLGQNGKFSLLKTNIYTSDASRKKLEAERARLIGEMKRSGGNAYANAGREDADYFRQRSQAWEEGYTTKKAFADKWAKLDKIIDGGGPGAQRARAQQGAMRDSVLAGKISFYQGAIDDLQKRLATERDPAKARRFQAGIASLRQDLDGLKQSGSSAALQLGAFNAAAEGGSKGGGKGGKGGVGKLADGVAGLTGNIAALEEKLKGDVSTNLTKFTATLNAGGFKGKSAEEIALMRREAILKDQVADQNAAEQANKRYENSLSSMAGRLAELNDELVGGQGNLAKFEAQVKSGKFDGLSQDQIDNLREAARAIDDAEKQLRIKDLDKDIAKASAEATALWGNYNSGAEIASRRIAGIRAQFEEKTIGLFGKDLEDMQRKIDELVQKLQSVEAAKQAQDWSDQAAQMNIELLPQEQQAQAQFEREDKRNRAIVDSYTQGTMERQRVEAAYYAWKQAKEAQVARAGEHSVVKLMRDWANLGQRMQETFAQAMSTFVDGLVDGKLAFGDFAKSMLKQLLKIIIQAMIAYAILSALGMAPSGGFGGFMKTQIGQGFGFAAPTNHHGGTVGDGAGMTKMVSSAMFAAASKYHTGGGISKLGPKEVPLIGLEGERVLNEEQQRQLGKEMAEGGAGTKAPPVTVNVINNGEPVSAEAGQPEFDGKEYVIGVVLDSLNKQGRLRDSVAAIGKQ